MCTVLADGDTRKLEIDNDWLKLTAIVTAEGVKVLECEIRTPAYAKPMPASPEDLLQAYRQPICEACTERGDCEVYERIAACNCKYAQPYRDKSENCPAKKWGE